MRSTNLDIINEAP